MSDGEMSTGVGNLIKLMAGWGLAFAIAAVTIVHFDEVRAALGLRLGPEAFGIAVGGEPQKENDEGVGRAPAPARSVQLARGSDGHFHADASINGRSLPVLVDTGATAVVLTYEDAAAAGIYVNTGDFRYISNTANGQARFARVTLDVIRIGDVSVRHVEAAVSQPGKLKTSLLGMSFLGQLRVEMQGRTLLLEQ